MQEQKSPLPFWAKFYYHMTTVMFLMAVLGIVARFVPSPYIVDNLFWLTLALGAAFMVSLGLMNKYYSHPRWSNPSKIDNFGPNQKVVVYIAGLFLLYFVVRLALFSGIPFVGSFVFGAEGEQIITVVNPDSSTRRCRNGIRIEEDFLFGVNVCGVPASFREKLNKGDQIRLIGIKTIMGIRVQSVALVDAP